MSQDTSDFDALDELMGRVWEQPSDALLRQQLNQLLDGNPRDQQRYLEYQLLHAELMDPTGPLAQIQQSAIVSQSSDTTQDPDPEWIAQLTNGSDLDPKGQGESVDKDAITARMLFSLTGYLLGQALTTKLAYKAYGVAAAVLVAVTLFLLFGPGDDGTARDPLAGQIPATDSQPDSPSTNPVLDAVATLTAEHDAQWAEGASAPGSPLRAGQRLTLTAGFAEITTTRGAVAILEAPATIELTDNDNAIRLHAGKLVGICETPTSKGFVVKTQHADIVDLGTEFGVELTATQLTTTVFTGEVVLHTPDHPTLPLTANQTARLTDVDSAPRLAIEDQAAVGFTLRLPTAIAVPPIQSEATPIAAWDFCGNIPDTAVCSGDVSTASGLQMSGFTGQWGTLPPHQGAIRQPDRSFITGEATGVSNGITLRWAVDGVGATRWAHELEDAEHALFGDYYFIRNPSHWGGAAIPWRIEGLTPGARYDLIFFGLDSRYHDGALIAINGHDAGNGVGAPATLDDDNDANFTAVIADADGSITGTFGALPGDYEAVVSGVQIGHVPRTGEPHPNTNP